MSKVYKITTIGDIMCEPDLLKQVTKEDGYDFMPVFRPLKSLFDEADYVIGNLETPLAGEEAGYTASLVSFNTPDDIAKTLKELGMDLVSTANNHTLDRDLAGNVNTLDALDRIGLVHTGSYRTPDEKDRIAYFTLGETKIAVIAYTYSTNEVHKNENGEKTEDGCINRLRPAFGARPLVPKYEILTNTRNYIKELTGHTVTWEESIRLKRILGVPVAYADNNFAAWEYDPCLEKLRKDVEEAKKNADLVFFLPHTGGQFNTEPGICSEYVAYKSALMGVDVIYAAHSHTTQKFGLMQGVPCFYSLGNVTMWPHSTYSVRETLPEYGIAAHAYVQDGKLVKHSFSLFKMVQDEGVPLTVVPVDELLGTLTDPNERRQLTEEVGTIYTRITGKPAPAEIQREYGL